MEVIDRQAVEEQLAQVNALSLWDYEVYFPEPGRVRILGSNDFPYWHYLELDFHNVTFCDLPPSFSHARFRLGDTTGEHATFWITADFVPEVIDPPEYEVQASALAVRIGKVEYRA